MTADARTRPAFEWGTDGELDPRRWVVLAVILTATFMVLLDISIVNVAIPSIQRNLHATYGQVQFVIALYSLPYALVLITGGRLGDIFGRKRLFIVGVSGFTLASALCGLAQSPEMLIISRVVQGTFAALMYPQVLSITQITFPPRERATAFALFGAIIGIGSITGPLLGGLLIQANLFDLEWRPIFLVNLPVGIGSVVAAWMLLRESKAQHANRLDPIGVLIVSVGLFLLIYPLIEGRDAGWPLWAFVSMALSLPVLVLFLVFERGKTAREDSPLVDMHLFSNRAFVAGILISLLLLSGVGSFFLTFSLYMQIGLGFTALHAGLTTVPFALGSMVSSGLSARLLPRMGKRILSLGASIVIVGIVLLIAVIHVVGTDITSLKLAAPLLVTGFGFGFIVAPLVNIVLAGVDPHSAGSASGVLTTMQQIGSAMGIALVGVIFFGYLGANADAASATVRPGLVSQVESFGVPSVVANDISRRFAICFHDRANAKDPSENPPTCQSLRPPKGLTPAQQASAARVPGVLQAQALQAVKKDFTDSVQVGMLFNLAVFFVVFCLIPLLPRPANLHLGGEAAAAH